MAGYAIDSWAAYEANIVKEGLLLENGAYLKGFALVVPDIADVKGAILQELHDSDYTGYVGIHGNRHNVK